MCALATGAVAAKAKAMYGERLKESDYEELIRKRSVSEIAAYLKNNTVYASSLKDIHELTIHRGQLEQLLHRNLFERMMKLFHYAGKSNADYYQFNLQHIEIDEILSRIRMIKNGNFDQAVIDIPLYLDKYTKLDLVALTNARTFDDLLSICKSSFIYKTLLECKPEKGEPIDYTRCENALEKVYYNHVFQVIEKSFKGKQKKDLIDMFATKVELANITKIYRHKKFFQSPPNVIRNSLLQVKNRLTNRMIEELIMAPTAEAVLKLLEASPYHVYTGESDFVFIEYYSEKIKYHLAHRFMHFSTKAPIVFGAYYQLAEVEIENLINIIEGVRYHISSDEIEKMLIY